MKYDIGQFPIRILGIYWSQLELKPRLKEVGQQRQVCTLGYLALAFKSIFAKSQKPKAISHKP